MDNGMEYSQCVVVYRNVKNLYRTLQTHEYITDGVSFMASHLCFSP